MKKIVLSIISLLSAVSLSFGVSGCSEKNSQQENNNPPNIQKPTEDETNDENRNSDDKILITETEPYYDLLPVQYNWNHADISYSRFVDYLNTEFKPNGDKLFYLWTPNAEIFSYGDTYNAEGYNYDIGFEAFKIYANRNDETGILTNPIVRQNITIFTKDWKENSDAQFYKSCVDMEIVSAGVDNAEGELSVKFGELSRSGMLNNYYANIYCVGSCVATCYIGWSNEIISLKWCENYLKSHLYLWG